MLIWDFIFVYILQDPLELETLSDWKQVHFKCIQIITDKWICYIYESNLTYNLFLCNL